MQSDAFPTPPIYSLSFQPRLVQQNIDLDKNEQEEDSNLNYLLNEIELLITDCSSEESEAFWSAANRIKIKYQVMESMKKIESLFLHLAKESTQDPELISAVSESLLYKSTPQRNSQNSLEMPSFLKQRFY